MPLENFKDLMDAAEDGAYAVGYFESWDQHSLLAVADAAELARSPVLLGFSGLHLNHPDQLVQDPLSDYAVMGLEVCRRLSVPAALVYNESPEMDSVIEAAELGFSLVMYSDGREGSRRQLERVSEVAKAAHNMGASVEGEIHPLPGMDGLLFEPPEELLSTGIDEALAFSSKTGVDALAVNLGQVHLHGRREVKLDLDRLRELTGALSLPLALHGASSVREDDLREAIALGIRKVNVGSSLKQAYFQKLREACNSVDEIYNPYVTVGSGLEGDVLTAARLALRDVVVGLMNLFGSAGQA